MTNIASESNITLLLREFQVSIKPEVFKLHVAWYNMHFSGSLNTSVIQSFLLSLLITGTDD